ncbi:MAG: low molecular weight phosphotyrosine protein phosphatase [Cryomorphaceae bacterium]|nr:low molecular weight phosphotyrosine protein phosphatase [Cryomorphaceae bacterium]
MKILMVCLGNICRSPLAEGLLKSKVDKNVEVDSAGTSGFHFQEPPDSRMIRTAKKHGIDLRQIRSRPFVYEDFARFDRIYAMDNDNYNNILSMAKTESDKEKVFLILNEIYPEENMGVPDPYFGGDRGFEEVFDFLDKATDEIVKKIGHG